MFALHGLFVCMTSVTGGTMRMDIHAVPKLQCTIKFKVAGLIPKASFLF